MLYMLDTNVVIRKPDLLAREEARNKFVLPMAVVNQLSSRAGGAGRERLLDIIKAATEGGVKLISTPIESLSQIQSYTKLERLDEIDRSILATLAVESRKNEPITLVTDDNALRRAAEANNLSSMSLGDFLKYDSELKGDTSPPTVGTVEEKVKLYDRDQATWLANAAAFGIAGVLLFQLGSFYFREIIDFAATVPWWAISVVGTIAGFLLYLFRQRKRAPYGLVEVVVGVVAVTHSVPSPGTPGATMGVVAVQLLGGLYIIVRGLDNIGTGLTNANSRYAPIWKRIFG